MEQANSKTENMEPSCWDSHPDDVNTFVEQRFKMWKSFDQDTSTNPEQDQNGCSREEESRDPEQLTKFLPTNAHGELRLHGYRRLCTEENPKYIRTCLHDEDGKENLQVLPSLWTLLTEYWKIPKPEIILSINGGHKNMTQMPLRLDFALKKGLLSIAESATTWFITPGFNNGVGKFVGEAVRDFSFANTSDIQVVAIGMATWGAVYDRQKMEKTKETEASKNKMHVADYTNTKDNPGKGQAVLDPHHTHFILCDDGTEGQFNSEVDFRAKFEIFIAKKMEAESKCSPTATVQVVIEGGKRAIEIAYKALEAGTPVIFIRRSGRCADLVCELLSFWDSTKDEEARSKKIKELLQPYKTEWQLDDDEKVKFLSDMLKSMCTEYRKLVSSFNIYASERLDRQILLAIFKSPNFTQNLEDRLDLAMKMNRCDVAAQEIFSDKNRSERHVQKLELHTRMFEALERGLAEFVELFLDHGISIDSYLDVDKLEKLYKSAITNKQSSREAELFRELINEEKSTDDKILMSVGRLVQKFTGDCIPNLYGHDEVISQQPATSTRKKEENSNKHKNDNVKVFTSFPPRSDEGKRMYTEQDLFLWAVFLNRMYLAKIFWRLGKDHIGSALVACAIFRRLQARAKMNGEVELSESLKENRNDFEELAVGILAVAYKQDKDRAHLLLIRGLPYWGNKTLLSLAYQSRCMKFMSHTAVQTRLSKIWNGDMSHNLSWWKKLFFALSGLIAIRLIFQLYCKNKLEMCCKSHSTRSKVHPTGEYAPTSDSAQQATIKPSQTYLDKFRLKQDARKRVSYLKALKSFYFAPMIKFLLNVVFYVIFVLLFAYLVLVDLKPLNYYSNNSNKSNICTGVQTASTCTSPTEIVAYFWMVTLIVEEIRQAITGNHIDFLKNFKDWLLSGWNTFDLLLYFIFVVAIILRYKLQDSNFIHTMNAFALVLAMLILRFMQMFYVNRTLGPKVVMIRKMVNDIIFFFNIFCVFLLAYGTAAQALLYNTTDRTLSFDLVKKVIYYPYWQVYGELSLEVVEGKEPGQTPNALVVILFGVYMLFTNVLLLNLLIAMLGYTFQRVQNSANEIWKYKRYRFTKEYYDRPFLVPPFNILEIIFRVIRMLISKYRGREENEPSDFKVILDLTENHTMTAFEKKCMEHYMTQQQKLSLHQSTESSAEV